jgi:alpha-tubulin suppressor-like RCC1 family protein
VEFGVGISPEVFTAGVFIKIGPKVTASVVARVDGTGASLCGSISATLVVQGGTRLYALWGYIDETKVFIDKNYGNFVLVPEKCIRKPDPTTTTTTVAITTPVTGTPTTVAPTTPTTETPTVATTTTTLAPATIVPRFRQSISAGEKNTAILRNDGTVWTFGSNDYGQLGRTTTALFDAVPAAVPGLTNITSISTLGRHVVALRADGTVWTFGANRFGELGRPNSPIPPSFSDEAPHPTAEQVPGISNAVAVAAGADHTVVLIANGTILTFGYNGSGQLGRPAPVGNPFVAFPTPLPVPGLSNIISVAAGFDDTVVLSGDGTIWTFGYNGSGELGRTTASPRPNSSPGQVPGLSGVVAIAAGGNHTIALLTDKTIWTFGSNQFGALGRITAAPYPNSVPLQVPGLTDVVAISTSLSQSAAVRADGTLWTFGENFSGQLGRVTADTGMNPSAQPADGLSNVSSVAVGYDHTVALLGDGTIWTVGGNTYGQIGRTNLTFPDPVFRQVTGISNVAQPGPF